MFTMWARSSAQVSVCFIQLRSSRSAKSSARVVRRVPAAGGTAGREDRHDQGGAPPPRAPLIHHGVGADREVGAHTHVFGGAGRDAQAADSWDVIDLVEVAGGDVEGEAAHAVNPRDERRGLDAGDGLSHVLVEVSE